MKKKLPVYLFSFLGVLLSGVVFADDVPLFSSETPVKKEAVVPNFGDNAQRVSSLQVMPPPFPPIEISADREDIPDQPFGNQPPRVEKEDENLMPQREIRIVEKKVNEEVVKDIQISADDEAEKNRKVVEQALADAARRAEILRQKKLEQEVQKEQQTAKQTDLSVPEYNVAEFNLAGLQLYMEPQEVIDVAQEHGFVVSNIFYDIPAFMTEHYEVACRKTGLSEVRMVHECTRDKAKEDEVYYVSKITLENKDNKEKIDVLFSSNFMDNKAYKIDYTGFGDNSLGTSYKDVSKKLERRDVFWRLVFEKYGRPSYNKMLLWGDPRNIYMKAYMERNSLDARIVMEDKTVPIDDMNKAAVAEAEREKEHNFSFVED